MLSEEQKQRCLRLMAALERRSFLRLSLQLREKPLNGPDAGRNLCHRVKMGPSHRNAEAAWTCLDMLGAPSGTGLLKTCCCESGSSGLPSNQLIYVTNCRCSLCLLNQQNLTLNMTEAGSEGQQVNSVYRGEQRGQKSRV